MFRTLRNFGAETRFIIGAALALALLAVSGVLSYWNAQQLISTSRWVARTHAAIASQDELLARLTEAESGMFGYVITGERSFLDPYLTATNRVEHLMRELRTGTADSPAQRAHFTRLAELVPRRLQFIQNRIEVFNRDGREAAMALIRKQEAKLVMDDIRKTIAEMTAEENRLLAAREQAVVRRARLTLWFDAGFGVTSVTLLAIIFALLLKENVQRRASEISLRQARDELEVRVSERTRDLSQSNHALQGEIEEHKRTLLALRESEERMRAIFNNAVEAIITIDERGIVETINPAAERMFGYSAQELAGRNVSVLVPAPHREHHDRYIADYLRTGHARVIGIGREAVAVRKDGTTLPVELSICELRLGERRKFTGILRDITERKQAERKLSELARDLADKNKDLELLVYVASHDLRSPLVNIQGFSRELLRLCSELRAHPAASKSVSADPALRGILDVEIPETVEFIQAGTTKIDRLLSAFLRFSRLGRAALRIEPLHTDAMVRDIAKTMEYQLHEKGVKLQIDPLPDCLGDEIQTGQVFSNLLDNAVKYLDQTRPGVIHVTSRKDDGHVVFAVKDNGVGIPAADRARVFEIFQRLNPGGVPGEGLGLTIAKRILERQNGKIWVESVPGEGSTFCISLPAAKGAGEICAAG
ncbi:MAG: PAS domain S-box protein [Verrucomicrobiota bacterium]